MKFSSVLVRLFSLSIGLAACAVDPSEVDTAPALMLRQDVCVQTLCERGARACYANSNNAYSSCLANCVRSTSPSCFQGCNSISSARCNATCDPAGPCAETSVRFIKPRRDESVAAACGRFAAHLASCGSPVNRAACEVYARVQVPSMAEVYDCYARQPCGATTNTCEPTGPARGTASVLADRMDALCGNGAFSPEFRAFITTQDHIARPDVLDAVLSCQRAASCDAMQSCLTAWLDAIQN